MRHHDIDITIASLIPATPSRGVNPVTALALLMTTFVFSAITFFGAANAMLPVPRPAQADLRSEPAGSVPALRSDDGSSVVALEIEAPAAPAQVGGAAEPAAEPAAAAPRDGHHGPRPGRVGGGAAGHGEGGAAPAPDRNLIRPGCRDLTDPLCGMEGGGGLDV